MKPILHGHRHLHDILVVFVWLAGMTLAGRLFLLHNLDISIIIMLYLLTVFFISRFTSGYVYGVVASILSVFLFNFFFTVPYFSFSAYDPKYPLIFLIMLVVSLVTSTMTIRIRKTAEEKIRLAQIQEKTRLDFETERLRSTILRSISHDLRTPLTSISGAASLLIDDSKKIEDEERTRLLADIHAESVWLNRFVENMLSLTRIDDPLMKLDMRPELVEEIVGEAVGLARRRLNRCRIDVSVPDGPILVEVDSSLIGEVLANLLDNAAAHTPTGGRIELSVRREGDGIVFRIRDHGPGIPPDAVGRIFERYYVGLEPRYDSKRGQGLGLTLCNTIVQAHRGRMTAENHPDGGAVFEFVLPAPKEAA